MAITPDTNSLQSTMTAIRDRVLARLESDDPRLAGIKSVFYGEQQRIGSLASPSFWVVADQYSPEPAGGSSMLHRVPYNVVALVKHTEPSQGIRDAEWYADGAYDVLMEGRTLDDTVSITKPGYRDPGYEAGQNQQLQFAAVQLIFEFRRKE